MAKKYRYQPEPEGGPMRPGWKGEPERHGLARRGIHTRTFPSTGATTVGERDFYSITKEIAELEKRRAEIEEEMDKVENELIDYRIYSMLKEGRKELLNIYGDRPEEVAHVDKLLADNPPELRRLGAAMYDAGDELFDYYDNLHHEYGEKIKELQAQARQKQKGELVM